MERRVKNETTAAGDASVDQARVAFPKRESSQREKSSRSILEALRRE
jgi:hypothetical protein